MVNLKLWQVFYNHPIRIAWNKDTIYNCVSAIIKAFKCYHKSLQILTRFELYKDFKLYLFWGFSHDSITKFGRELLGIFIQGTDSITMEPTVAPKFPLQIKSGHTTVDLVNCLISVIAKHINIKGSAYHKIQSYLERTDHDYDSNVSSQEYFQLGVIHHVNKNDKEIHIETKNIWTANTGDGFALNGRTSRLDAPCYHYAVHSSDIVMKRMAKSNTMSVPKLSKLMIAYEELLNISKWVPKARRNWMKHW